MLAILFLIIALVTACQPGDCGARRHTTWFEDHFWRGNSTDFWIRLPYTDPCEHVDLAQLAKEFPVGAPGFHPELTGWAITHVIDPRRGHIEALAGSSSPLGGSPYAHCDPNIRANFVATNTRWTKRVVNLCCDAADEETRRVFGNQHLVAISSIATLCCTKATPTSPVPIPMLCVAGIALIGLVCSIAVHWANEAVGAVALDTLLGNRPEAAKCAEV